MKMEKLLYLQFKNSKERQVYVKGKDLLVSGTKEAEKEIKDQLTNIDNKLKKDGDEYLEKYTAYIMDSMQKN